MYLGGIVSVFLLKPMRENHSGNPTVSPTVSPTRLRLCGDALTDKLHELRQPDRQHSKVRNKSRLELENSKYEDISRLTKTEKLALYRFISQRLKPTVHIVNFYHPSRAKLEADLWRFRI